MKKVFSRGRIIQLIIGVIGWLLAMTLEDSVKNLIKSIGNSKGMSINPYTFVLTLLLITYVVFLLVYWKLQDRSKAYRQGLENKLNRLQELITTNTGYASELYKQHGLLKNEVNSTRELVGMMNKTGSITTRAIAGYINSLKSENEIVNAVDALYGKCTIPELKEIGLSGTVIHLMETRYHAEKLGEAKAKIEFFEPKSDDIKFDE